MAAPRSGAAVIERIEVFVTDLPNRLRRQISSGAMDTGPPGAMLGKPVLVKLMADGVAGYGQIRPITPSHFLPDTVHSVFGAIADIYGPRLIGRDAFDLEAIGAEFDRSLPGNVNARAVLDHALHDLMGRALGVPVHKLLGGLCQNRIPLEWSISMADQTETMVADSERAVDELGIRILCVKMGSPHGLERDIANFRAVRAAVGWDVMIGCDPNTAWSVPDAIRTIRALADQRLDYVEQPIARRDLEGLASIRHAIHGVPLMADESLQSLDDAYQLVRAGAVDAFCIKLYKVGGLATARKIVAVADAANVRLNVGGVATMSQLEAAAGAHFYASIPAHRFLPGAEFVFGVGAMGPDPIVPETDFVLSDGHVEPPSGPGLGVTVDDQAVARHALRHEVVTA